MYAISNNTIILSEGTKHDAYQSIHDNIVAMITQIYNFQQKYSNYILKIKVF